MSFLNYETIYPIYQAMIYIALPIIVLMMICGFVVGIFQSFLTIREETISYGVKIIALCCFFYFFSSSIKEMLLELFRVTLS